MKKILITAIVCSGLMMFSSCNNFLDENPKSSLTLQDYYKTAAQATANVNYLYRNGAPTEYSNAGSAYVGPFATLPGMLSGYFSNDYEGQELACKYSRLLTRQANTMTISEKVDGVWDDCYNAINVANGAIQNIPNISMDATLKATLMAEAKFFRAFNYFYLVKIFGPIPLNQTPYISASQDMQLSRSTVADVYALIEADLKTAVDVLPAKSFASNSHRITKYAAAMLLTSVYMQERKYSDAATCVKIVVGSGVHGLTQNTNMTDQSAYNKLRSTDDLDEVIYAQEFDNSINSGGWWATYAFDASATSTFGTYSIFQRVYGPSNRYLNVYASNDLRIQNEQFFHWTYTNPNTGKTWAAPKNQDGTYQYAGCWYYYDADALLSTGKASKDWNFFRYAEALLDAAECIAQTSGVTPEAAGYLAQVQARANTTGQSVADITTQLQSLQKEDFIEACWTERLREFPLEFKMWDDCLRTGKFPVISETVKGSVTYVDLVGATNAAGAAVKSSDLLWPVSLNEMQRNKKLTQNDGYASKE